MKPLLHIGQPFNQLDKATCLLYIRDHLLYADFNVLGLYRSLTEPSGLTLEDKIEIRDYAHVFFQKTFDFLPLKDPDTWLKVSTLGQELTRGDELQWWRVIRHAQEKIVKDKQLRHRNFGTYSKHLCGHDDCPYNGLMIRRGSVLAERCMYFDSDRDRVMAKEKSQQRRRDRKHFRGGEEE